MSNFLGYCKWLFACLVFHIDSFFDPYAVRKYSTSIFRIVPRQKYVGIHLGYNVNSVTMILALTGVAPANRRRRKFEFSCADTRDYTPVVVKDSCAVSPKKFKFSFYSPIYVKDVEIMVKIDNDVMHRQLISDLQAGRNDLTMFLE